MWRKLWCTVLMILSTNVWADDEVLVDKVWLRESVPGQDSASLQLNLTVTKSARLIGVSSPWARAVEIQRLSPGRGRISERVVKNLTLPRNRTLTFGDRRYALMLVGLKEPLKEGENVPVSLTVEFSGKRSRIVRVEAEVKRLELSYKHYGGKDVHDHR